MRRVVVAVLVLGTGVALCGGAATGCATAESKAQSAALLAALNSYDDTADAERVRERVSAMRARYGREGAATFMVVRSQLVSVKEMIADGWEPEVALSHAMQRTATDAQWTVRSWCIRVERLEDLKLPADLLRPPRLNLAIAIFRLPPEKGPQRYVVLFATPSFHQGQQR